MISTLQLISFLIVLKIIRKNESRNVFGTYASGNASYLVHIGINIWVMI